VRKISRFFHAAPAGRLTPLRIEPFLQLAGHEAWPWRGPESIVIHDLRRDWRRWTTAERVLASIILSILLIGLSATILLTA